MEKRKEETGGLLEVDPFRAEESLALSRKVIDNMGKAAGEEVRLELPTGCRGWKRENSFCLRVRFQDGVHTSKAGCLTPTSPGVAGRPDLQNHRGTSWQLDAFRDLPSRLVAVQPGRASGAVGDGWCEPSLSCPGFCFWKALSWPARRCRFIVGSV